MLKQIESGTGKNNQYEQVKRDGTDTFHSRSQAATQAGLSERQKVAALRVANVPAYAVCLPAAYACHRHLHR